jgi:carboxypeptidase T
MLLNTKLLLRVCACALAVASVPHPVAAAEHDSTRSDRSSFVTIRYQDSAQLQAIASQFQHLMVDPKLQQVKVDAGAEEIAALRAAGFDVQFDAALTQQLRSFEAALQSSGSMKSIPGYACYRTVEETYAAMNSLVAARPNLASIIDIGPSFEKSRNGSLGYTMKVLRIGNAATDASLPDKPNMVVLASIHAREYTPAELLTRFAEWLLNGYGSDPEATWLVDHNRFHLVLQSNPDGRKKAEAGASWRKNTNNTNGSCSSSSFGTDLNRNFPFHWNSVAGGSSGDPCNETYRGPLRASEPETRNIVQYVAGTANASGVYAGGVLPDRRGDATNIAAPSDYKGMFIDIHSYSQLVLWPWGDTATQAPNGVALRTLGRRMAWFNNYRPQQSDELYATDGTTDDTFYGSLGAPAYAFELGVAFFESCTTFQNTTLPNNLAALKYAARNLQAPYVSPAGPDALSLVASPASVTAGTSITLTASINDTRFNQSNGSETVHAISSATASIDRLPWESGYAAIAMTASDGSFNSNTEAVRATINTTGLSAGQHRLYVRGTDSAGVTGPPQAVFFTITAGGGNQPPVANYSYVSNGLVVNFSDSSSDPDGSIASRSWNFGDGTTSIASNPSKTYSAAGSYTVVLTVTDNLGASNSTSKTVVVSTTPPPGNVLSNGVPATGLSAATGASLNFTMQVPAGATALKFVTSGGTGDSDMYVRFGSAPTDTVYDCRPYLGGNAETCNIATAQAGTYHVRLKAYAAFSGLTLTGSYSTGSPPPGAFFQNLTDYAIADNATVDSPITVSGVSGNAPATLSVSVNIVHTYQGDLKVDLVAPDGSLYNIHNRTGAGTDNIIKTVTINASSEVANGIWKLRVNDNASGDAGYINSWSMQF